MYCMQLLKVGFKRTVAHGKCGPANEMVTKNGWNKVGGEPLMVEKVI